MRMKKILAAILVIVVSVSMAVPAIASVGYPGRLPLPDSYEPGPSSSDSSSSSSSSSSGGTSVRDGMTSQSTAGQQTTGAGSTVSASTATTATPAATASAATSAVSQAVASGSKTAAAYIQDVTSVSKEALTAAFNAAANTDVALVVGVRDVVTNADGKKAVATQINLTAANLANLPANVDLTVTEKPADVQAVMENSFVNPIKTVSAPTIGSDYELCLKPEVANPVVYTYDPVTGQMTKMDPSNYFVDTNGYLHIIGGGGNYVISSGDLQAK